MQIEAGGIATNRVRDYHDKENIQRLIDGVATFCDDCAKQLSFEDAMTVQTCLDYQSDERELQEAIEWAKGREDATFQLRATAAELELKQRELDSIREKTRPRFHPAVSYTALVIATLSLALPLLWLPPRALTLFGWIAAYFLWIFLTGIMRRETPEVLALRSEIQSLQKEVLEPTSDDALSRFEAKFGKKSSAEYEKLLQDRQQAISELLEPNTVATTNK
jgi:hypothetical protein